MTATAAQIARQMIQEARQIAAHQINVAEVAQDRYRLLALGLTQADATRIAERIHFTN
jgi:hypothetical protein